MPTISTSASALATRRFRWCASSTVYAQGNIATHILNDYDIILNVGHAGVHFALNVGHATVGYKYSYIWFQILRVDGSMADDEQNPGILPPGCLACKSGSVYQCYWPLQAARTGGSRLCGS